MTGSPTLIDAVVVFDCNLIAVHDGFTHSILVGQVQSAEVNEDIATDCLLWHRHGFARARQGRRDLVGLRLSQLSLTSAEATRGRPALAGDPGSTAVSGRFVPARFFPSVRSDRNESSSHSVRT